MAFADNAKATPTYFRARSGVLCAAEAPITLRMIKVRLLPPHKPYSGNLLWDSHEAARYPSEINASLEAIRGIGYWASAFPEGDGVTFEYEKGNRTVDEYLSDFQSCFSWASIELDTTFSPQKALRQPKESKLSFEKNVCLRKSEIAMIQLEEAIELFMSGKRIPVITLAGAADGIFAGLLVQRGETSAAEDTWSRLEAMRKISGIEIPGIRNIRDAYREWNYHRNRLKHHNSNDEEHLEFSAFDQAYYSIERANADAKKLDLEARNLQEYKKWIIETLCL